jgi:hypothetical protein
MKERKAVTKATAERYVGAGKKEKGRILDEFVVLTRYNRSYARYVLRHFGESGKRLRPRESIKRKKVYDEAVLVILREVWEIMDYICGKRLQSVLAETIRALEQFGEMKLSDETREKLGLISAATIDRLLAAERKKYQLKGRARTRPGSLLKKQIPIRTFSDWDEKKPGFAEMDLVAHDGGSSFGDFLQTLNVTDVYSSWCEMQAVMNKAQVRVFEALKQIRTRLPFELLGLDSDNGSEFINDQLFRYCQSEHLTFTRSRPYRKNDNCFVEQKNYTAVRRHVGYQRMEGEEVLKTLNDLYYYLRLYINYFQPVMHLASKEREGSRVKKTYSPAETPFQRLLRSPDVSKKQKEKMRQEYESLNPAELKRRIEAFQEKLLRMAVQTRRKNTNAGPNHPWRQPRGGLSNQKHLE